MKKILLFLILLVQFFACNNDNVWRNSTAEIDDAIPHPFSVKSESNKSLGITFTKEVDEIAASDVSNYSIPGLYIESAGVDQLNKLLVHLTTSPQQNTIYNLSITNVLLDMSLENVQYRNIVEFIGDALPEIVGVKSISNIKVRVTFSEDMDESSSTSISNYSIPGLDIVSAGVDQLNKAIVYLTTSSQQNVTYNLSVNNIQDLTGNFIPSTTIVFTGDTLPDLVNAIPISSTAIRVSYSEKMITGGGSGAIDNISNYTIDGGITISGGAIISENVVELTVVFFNNGSYILTAQNVQDLAGNTIGSNNTASFLTNTTKTLVSSGRVQESMDISVNGTNIYVVYQKDESLDKDIMFIKSSDGGITWSSKEVIVDTTGQTGSYISIAAVNDRNGDGDDIYVAYSDLSLGTSLNICRSRDGGNNWGNVTVVNGSNVFFRYPSIAVIPGVDVNSDTIHISYQDIVIKERLMFQKSVNGGDNWLSSLKIIDNGNYTNNVGKYSSISVVDRDPDTIYVSYQDSTSGSLKFAKSEDFGLSWSTDNILTTGTVGLYSSIAVIGGTGITSDVINISCIDSAGKLYYSRSVNGGTDWLDDATITDIVTASEAGGYTSIAAIDNNVYISYYNNSLQDLCLQKSSNGGSSFVDQSIDSTGNTGKGSSIAVEDNIVYIIYQDVASSNLKFAKYLD